MTHDICRLTAKNRDQLRNPTLGNRVWATFTFLVSLASNNRLTRTSVTILFRPLSQYKVRCFVGLHQQQHNNNDTVLRPLHRSTCVSRHLQLRTEEDFVGTKFYCPHALADGNQRIRIREKTLEFSSTVLSTLSPNLRSTPKFAEIVLEKLSTWTSVSGLHVMTRDPLTYCRALAIAELSMGPFCMTRSNPTHQLTDPTHYMWKNWTQLDPTQYN